MLVTAAVGVGSAAAAWLLTRANARLRLSRAKHPSLAGHAKISKRFARLVPFYEYDERRFFDSDGAPRDVADRRRDAFARLSQLLRDRAPATLAMTGANEAAISDLQFTGAYRVPFQYGRYVREHLAVGSFVGKSKGVLVSDLDGNASYDLTGSYGVNVFGYDFYKECIEAGAARVRDLGPVLGSYHPVVDDNVRRLRDISGLDEVSFHMSGTEAVMQAVRLARYHTGRTHVVQFCGAYHGWWDGVQPGVGNPRRVDDVYLLRDLDERTLRVLETRSDIACVLVNPLQMLHPNAGAPGDGALLTSASKAPVDRDAYSQWLRRLRDVCARRGIVFVLDEVFLGFRLASGGAQEYFGVRADMVTYGKTVGGGLPIGVLCGIGRLMKRFKDDRPTDVCFARGTFNSHPYVMGAMNEFLRRIDTPEIRLDYARADALWTARATSLNEALARRRLPVQVSNLCSVWTIRYTVPSRYNWMFQFYLRANGLALSWIGSGRLIFSHNYSDADFAAVSERFVAAAAAMDAGGWWWRSASVTNGAIQRQVLREMAAEQTSRLTGALRTAMRLDARRPDRSARRGAPAAEPCSTASGRGTDR